MFQLTYLLIDLRKTIASTYLLIELRKPIPSHGYCNPSTTLPKNTSFVLSNNLTDFILLSINLLLATSVRVTLFATIKYNKTTRYFVYSFIPTISVRTFHCTQKPSTHTLHGEGNHENINQKGLLMQLWLKQYYKFIIILLFNYCTISTYIKFYKLMVSLYVLCKFQFNFFPDCLIKETK